MIAGLIITFISVNVLVFIVFYVLEKKVVGTEVQAAKRVKDFTREAPKGMEINASFVVKENTLSEIPTFNKLLENVNLSRTLSRWIEQAGIELKVGELLLRMGIFALIGLLVGFLFKNIILQISLFLILGLIPLIQILMKRAARLKAFITAFPDALDMMTSAIRAGHALNQAMQLVGDEAPEPVGPEFKRTFEQYNLGLNIKEALLALSQRVDSLDLKLFVTAILLQRETGGNLTEILEKISYTIRERFKLIGQIKTYTAQGRMSAWILGLLPVIFVLIISALNPGYLKPLFHDPMGHTLIVIATVFQIVGFLFIRKIVEIKYQ